MSFLQVCKIEMVDIPMLNCFRYGMKRTFGWPCVEIKTVDTLKRRHKLVNCRHKNNSNLVKVLNFATISGEVTLLCNLSIRIAYCEMRIL